MTLAERAQLLAELRDAGALDRTVDQEDGGLELRDQGKGMPLNDSWIAATAIAADIPVISQDDDYNGTPGLQVIRI